LADEPSKRYAGPFSDQTRKYFDALIIRVIEMDELLKKIEAQHWDYETDWVPPHIQFVQNERVTMIKNPRSTSIQANRVIHASFSERVFEEQFDAILQFYGTQPFSWWIGPRDRPNDLLMRLTQHGFTLIDEYAGLAIELAEEPLNAMDNEHEIREVRSDEDLIAEIDVSARVWGYNEQTKRSLFHERKAYLDLPSRRGGFAIAVVEGQVAGYSNYRYSKDGKTMYLNGSGVAPEFRRRGVYSALVKSRLNAAKAKGCRWVTTQARIGMSDHLLKSLGFDARGKYHLLIKGETS
jgi:GNAT superfamily N-acetyltransferase